MPNIKILLVFPEALMHYRVGLFNLLCTSYSVTIAHPGKLLEDACFKQHSLKTFKKGPFVQLKEVPDFSNFDTVIISFNIRILNLYQWVTTKRNFKLLFFGIGVSASYNNSYDSKKTLDFIRTFFIKKSDGAIFYEHYPVVKYQSLGISSQKLHVAYNTVLPPKNFDLKQKTFESFIFIGTLYKQKKIYDLLEAYSELIKRGKVEPPKLEIIGNGDEYNTIKNWIFENKLSQKVILHGVLTEEKDLNLIFRRAIACISPGQAGLSVQKCFSYGVPFVTTKSAITGGELFSIINNENGFLYDGSIEHLTEVLLAIATGDVNIKEISKKSNLFYNNFRNPNIWLSAFKNAIN